MLGVAGCGTLLLTHSPTPSLGGTTGRRRASSTASAGRCSGDASARPLPTCSQSRPSPRRSTVSSASSSCGMARPSRPTPSFLTPARCDNSPSTTKAASVYHTKHMARMMLRSLTMPDTHGATPRLEAHPSTAPSCYILIKATYPQSKCLMPYPSPRCCLAPTTVSWSRRPRTRASALPSSTSCSNRATPTPPSPSPILSLSCSLSCSLSRSLSLSLSLSASLGLRLRLCWRARVRPQSSSSSRRGGMVIVLLAAARAATHCSRGPPACSGLSSRPKRSALVP